MLGVLTWSGFVLFGVGSSCDEPYIPECKEKDLLFTLTYFGKVILFDCLLSGWPSGWVSGLVRVSEWEWISEWVSELVSERELVSES
jgi:hypothetical protein